MKKKKKRFMGVELVSDEKLLSMGSKELDGYLDALVVMLKCYGVPDLLVDMVLKAVGAVTIDVMFRKKKAPRPPKGEGGNSEVRDRQKRFFFNLVEK